MIKLYEEIDKKFKQVLVIDVAVIILVTILIVNLIKPGITLALALTALYAVLLCSVLYIINLYEKKATKKFQRTVDKLNSNTDLRGLERELVKLSKRNIDDKLHSFITVLLLGVYINQGKKEKAKEIVETFQPTYYDKEAGDLVRITYLNNITQYYIDIEELSIAKSYADLFIETVISAGYLSPEFKEKFKKNYKFKMSFMDILEDKEEEFDRIKRRCLTELNEETTLLEKLSYNYILSMIYKKEKNKKKYNECIEFIKDNCKRYEEKSDKVKKAKKKDKKEKNKDK